MNRFSLDRCAQAIGALIEGNSIRSTARMTGIYRDTIMRPLVEVGTGCGRIMDEQMCDLSCKRLQVDEVWTYVAEKQRKHRVTPAMAAGVSDWLWSLLDLAEQTSK